MVPQSASTCLNLGVFGKAQTKRVQSEFQSGLYSAPISIARDCVKGIKWINTTKTSEKKGTDWIMQ